MRRSSTRYREALEKVRSSTPTRAGIAHTITPQFTSQSEPVLSLYMAGLDHPTPPPEILAGLGSLYEDMAIHELDTALWFFGEKPLGALAVGLRSFSTSIDNKSSSGLHASVPRDDNATVSRPVIFISKFPQWSASFRLFLSFPGADEPRSKRVGSIQKFMIAAFTQ